MKITCFICEKTFSTHTDMTVVAKYGHLCDACTSEYVKEKSHLKVEANKSVRVGLAKWLKTRQAVKRVYRNQLNLPGTYEEE